MQLELVNGVYLRNTQNPVHQPLGKYHGFDGDGMLHLMRFKNGRCEYRNRLFGEGRFGSESPMAPSTAATAEDDGYVVSFVTDMNTHTSEWVVLDARNIAASPVARIMLPHQISSGTHSCWANASEIRSDWTNF